MSEKVKLPKEVAEALDKSKHMGAVAIMAHIARFGDEETMKTTLELTLIHSFYKENPYLIAYALVNGYEIEQTPEDKVREYYESQLKLKQAGRVTIQDCSDTAIVQVLDILNIKISGVNAE